MGSLESDTTEWLHFHFSLSCIGEGNGTPLQCSCLENPRDGEAWWAVVYGVAQSRTRLKRLSSSNSRQDTETKVSNSGDEMEKWRGNRCWVFVFITWRFFSTYSAWGERSVRIGIDCMLWWENMFIRILSQWDQDDGLTGRCQLVASNRVCPSQLPHQYVKTKTRQGWMDSSSKPLFLLGA